MTRNRTLANILNMKALAVLIGITIIIAVPFSAADAGTIKFKVKVVKAAREGSGFDGGLAKYKKQLMNWGFRSGKIVLNDNFAVNLNQKHTIKVAGDIKAEITPTSVGDNFIKFDFRMLKGGKVAAKLSYRLPIRKYTIIIGPAAKSSNYILIIEASK